MRSRASRACRSAMAIVAGVWCVTGSLALAGQGAAGAVAGSVAVRQSRQPVPGAVVSLEGTTLTAVVSQTGRFRIDNVPPGSVMLAVRAPGFLDAHVGAVQVRAGDTAQVDVELDVTPNFMERVQVTATKTPLSIGDVARPDRHRRPPDDREPRRPDADPGDQPRAGRGRQHAARHLRIGDAARHAARRSRVHQHAAAHRRRAPDDVAERIARDRADHQRRERHRSRARAQLRAVRADGHRRVGEYPDVRPDGEARVQRRLHRRPAGDGQRAGPRVGPPLARGAATTRRSARNGTPATSTPRPAATTRTATRRCSASSRSRQTASRSAASASTTWTRTTARRPTNRSSKGSCCTTSIRGSTGSRTSTSPGPTTTRARAASPSTTPGSRRRRRASSRCSATATSSSSSSRTATSSARRSTRSRTR